MKASRRLSKCFFIIGNTVFIQLIGGTSGYRPTSFWANLFMYIYEKKIVTSLGTQYSIHGFKYHGVMRFTDDLSTVNDGVNFGKSLLEVYPLEMELKGVNASKTTNYVRTVISFSLLKSTL